MSEPGPVKPNEPPRTRDRVAEGLRRRYMKERAFRLLGLAALLFGLGFLAIFFVTLVSNGASALLQTRILLDVELDPEVIDPEGRRDAVALETANYQQLIRDALNRLFPDVTERSERRALYRLLSPAADLEVRELVLANPALIGETRSLWLLADDDVDMLIKGNIDRDVPESERRLSDAQIGWIDALLDEGRIERKLNRYFFTSGDSRDPELAGIFGATVGSFFMLLVTLVLSFPLGVATAVYLEEFAPRNRWTDLIEVNINNLAAVPSIVFGLLGLALFINAFGLPRSAPLVGGLVLTLMTLPVIIIASRAALKAVPPSIREAALGIGASKMQTVLHHVLPLALPGMLTGTIIGMARALGESAPLLMIGMVAFIVDIPESPLDPATALPVQIFLWADSPERAFVERTSAAILVLLAFLVVMNGIAILLRKRFERRY
ncbi:MAG: phosphate ABC transporter permease PstA [Gammaproteobacteria bacterium]|nr:phosphate ABC transporter, permease protein PstA [Gammaproteobacteria bacterium]